MVKTMPNSIFTSPSPLTDDMVDEVSHASGTDAAMALAFGQPTGRRVHHFDEARYHPAARGEEHDRLKFRSPGAGDDNACHHQSTRVQPREELKVEVSAYRLTWCTGAWLRNSAIGNAGVQTSGLVARGGRHAAWRPLQLSKLRGLLTYSPMPSSLPRRRR
jgi:hypothetical protein